MAGVVPSDAVIRVLNPIVKTGEYPVNQAAVKMLTKVAENQESREVVIDHLGDIMPGLLRVIFILGYLIEVNLGLRNPNLSFWNWTIFDLKVSKSQLSQKTNEKFNFTLSSNCFRSFFFGRTEESINCFWDLLTLKKDLCIRSKRWE